MLFQDGIAILFGLQVLALPLASIPQCMGLCSGCSTAVLGVGNACEQGWKVAWGIPVGNCWQSFDKDGQGHASVLYVCVACYCEFLVFLHAKKYIKMYVYLESMLKSRLCNGCEGRTCLCQLSSPDTLC